MSQMASILLVEDELDTRLALRDFLTDAGFVVYTARNGQHALRTLEKLDPPDLILLDLLMPKMTGIEVLKTLRAEEATREIRVLILSNSSREQDVEEIKTLGVSGYFVKADLSLQALGDMVARLLEA